MSSDELHYLELLDLTRRIHAGDLTAVEATTAQLERIDRLDGTLRSYAHVTSDLALEQARRADDEIRRGDIRGPLHGAPIAVKDLCWTKGIPTAGGMPLHHDFKPPEDGTLVRRLREAGAVLLGKLQCTEGAFAVHHPNVPVPVNPWSGDYWSGASSSGSGVATAAGLCYGSIGSDTGGSIRFPSAANGITGLKPTWGRVSRHGAFELAATLDHFGPMTRSAADAGAMLGAIAGADPNDPTASQEPVPDYLADIDGDLRRLRIGIDPTLNSHDVDAEVVEALSAAIETVTGLGGEIREITFPDTRQILDDWLPLCAVQTAVAHEATYPARREEYGPALAGLLDVGRALSGLDYQKIILRREDFRGRVAALFEPIDLLVVPAQPLAPPQNSLMAALGRDPGSLARTLRFTAPLDMSGSPAITLPCGFTEGGLPIAFQFVSRHMREDLLIQAGHAYQQATDWHRRHPAL